MYPYEADGIPTVFISNTAETFFEYVSRPDDLAEAERLIREMQMLGDRNILYPRADKLVVTSLPLAHTDLIRQRLNYYGTEAISPQVSSPCLSLDIVREPDLLQRIVAHAGAAKTIQLIPHGTTPEFLQLATMLQTDYQLRVLLPESPPEDGCWLRDYIDTKAGFRSLVGAWLPTGDAQLPVGFVCPSLSQAARAVLWFLRRDRPCMVKADRGLDAMGHSVFYPQEGVTLAEIVARLQLNPFLKHDLIIVEEFIVSGDRVFPSVELFVPSPDMGAPFVTYVCNQLFLASGIFSGILVSQELHQRAWYAPLVASGLHIAHQLQALGYVGHFDLDAIVADDQLFLIEINARRTGGTHVHEVGCFLLGEHYLDQVVLLSNTALESGAITQFEILLEAIAEVLYPMQDQPQGLIITHTSALSSHKFGGVIVAPTLAMALALQQRVRQLVLGSEE